MALFLHRLSVFGLFVMDSLPPNDPNSNGNGNGAGKEAPYDGRNRAGGSRGGNNGNQPMDVLGNMQDSPVVVVMFLFGLINWLMRERCVC
jgi:hypothetical protein